VLPGEKEPHVIGGADGLDLRPQAGQRVAVDTREQPAVAPLARVRTRRERAAQHDAFGLQRRQGDGDIRFGGAEWRAESAGCRRSEHRNSPAQHLQHRRLIRVGGTQARHQFGGALGRAPEVRGPGRQTRRPSGVCQGIGERQPGAAVAPAPNLGIGQEARDEQRVVKLVGVTGIRPGFVADPRNRVGVERAEIVGRGRLERPPRVHRLRPPLLERSVVEKRVRPGVEDLGRER
jgi:hypothetical protein